MGRGQKGPIDQSRKKPKNIKDEKHYVIGYVKALETLMHVE